LFASITRETNGTSRPWRLHISKSFTPLGSECSIRLSIPWTPNKEQNSSRYELNTSASHGRDVPLVHRPISSRHRCERRFGYSLAVFPSLIFETRRSITFSSHCRKRFGNANFAEYAPQIMRCVALMTLQSCQLSEAIERFCL